MNGGDEFTKAVEKMEPGTELKAKVMALYPQTAEVQTRRRKPVLKYAACFLLLAVMLFGGAMIQPMQPLQSTGLADYGVAAPATGFTVVVNAATTEGAKQTELKPGREFQLAPDKSLSGAREVMEWGDRNTSNWAAYYAFQLKCIGSDITKVTYETNRGEFRNLVHMNIVQKAYYDAHRTLNGLPMNDLEPAGKNMAYQPAGTVKTLAPDSDGTLYLKLTYHTDTPAGAETEKDMKFTTKCESKILEGTKIKITVFFKNGTQSTKTVRRSYPNALRSSGVKIAAVLVSD